MDEQGFGFDDAVGRYEEEFEDRLREILRDYVGGDSVEEVVRRILPIAQRFAGGYGHAVERRRIRNKRQSEAGENS